MKYGFIWSCMTSGTVEEIVFADGIIDRLVYLDILKNNLQKCADKLGLKQQQHSIPSPNVTEKLCSKLEKLSMKCKKDLKLWKMEDQRFKSFVKDPRCRDIPKNVRKVKVDKRFQKLLRHKQFKGNSRIDERGRIVNFSNSEKLKKLYNLKDSSEDDSPSENSEDEQEDFKEKNSSPLKIEENEKSKKVESVDVSEDEGKSLQDKKSKHLQKDKTKVPKLISDLPENIASSDDDTGSSEDEEESIDPEDESKNLEIDSVAVQKNKEKVQKQKTKTENVKSKKSGNLPDGKLSDKSAKSATEFLTRPIVYADVRSAVNQWCHCQWQEKWNMETNNKLHVIKPVLSHWVTKLNRCCDVVLTRLRIGHTRLTHKYLLFAESPPTCSHCGDILTVKHILTDCVAVNRRRLRYFCSSSFDLSFLLGQIPHFNLFMYLKDIGVFHDI
ncbi:hypothetical protein AVEN_40943-1 [Araneus ventricosus]|uniref:Uncharacterized protein n=1 Tax=Araneus ventricosus TaxID=182803 RepID=A0A4Y2S231_ARAVE|nr:hypothetical protein AVEN_40943-1 [Araneus ventricosus]